MAAMVGIVFSQAVSALPDVLQGVMDFFVAKDARALLQVLAHSLSLNSLTPYPSPISSYLLACMLSS